MADEEKKLFLKIDGRQYGPVSVETVKKWIDESRLGPDDYVRLSTQKVWVHAKNVEHLNSIFHMSKTKARTEAFTSWIDAVGSGSATILTYEGQKAERERILSEQRRLEAERLELEDLAKQAEMTKEQAAALDLQRADLDRRAKELEAESDEIMNMERAVKKRRKRQTTLVVVIIAIVAIGGTWLTIDLISKTTKTEELSAELRERIKGIDDRLAAIDSRLTQIDKAIAQASAAGNVGLVVSLEAERSQLEEQRTELKVEREKQLHAETPEVDTGGPQVQGRTGKIGVAGPVQITGEGAADPGRSQTEIRAAVSSALGQARQKYNELLKTNPNASGSISIIFGIQPDGSVENATFSNSTLPDANLIGPILSGIRGLSFSAIEGGSVRVTYPLSLTPQ
ncbi:MAG: AgmX/PglI C-terminal domain-containing protein [bacterium]|nr:AgmX/PglI C-terminal domain-containing protein [bacterium]